MGDVPQWLALAASVYRHSPTLAPPTLIKGEKLNQALTGQFDYSRLFVSVKPLM